MRDLDRVLAIVCRLNKLLIPSTTCQDFWLLSDYPKRKFFVSASENVKKFVVNGNHELLMNKWATTRPFPSSHSLEIINPISAAKV